MQTSLQKTRTEALHYILSQQQPDGSFLSNQSKSTTFYASLVSSTLSTCPDPGAMIVQQRVAAFLVAQQHENGSFNYWAKDAAEYGECPYPNDFDDTAIALRALHAYQPSLITEQVLAHVTSLLISHEIAPGGPYQTWIFPPAEDSWHDVDIVVNSNIASLLSGLDITLLPLELYFDDLIEKGDFSSRYYDHELIVLHFLSRAYKGMHATALKDRILSHRTPDGGWGNPLFTALSITALLALGIEAATLTPAIEYLLGTSTHGKWETSDFFVESIRGSVPTYSSCDAYVSACCIEALALYEEKMSVPLVKSPYDDSIAILLIIRETCKKAFSHLPFLIGRQLDQSLAMLTTAGSEEAIALLPYFFARQLRPEFTIPDATLTDLAVMNVLGWIGYTVYDGILDGEDKVGLLPLANVCARIVSDITHKYVTNPEQYLIVQRILDGIAGSTLWEYEHCRIMDIAANGIPDYGSYHCLAEKSLGHALGPIIICLLCKEYDQADNVEQFFRHYLIARQLNDDAHDWLEDLDHGYVNSVSAPLLRAWQHDTGNIVPNGTTDILLLQDMFWQQYIERASADILHHCDQARLALKKITLLREVTFLEALIDPLERSARNAIEERDSTRNFLALIDCS